MNLSDKLWEETAKLDGWTYHKAFGLDELRKLELDAMKEGARRAAEVCVQYKNYGDLHPPINTRNAILALVENLTLNDL